MSGLDDWRARHIAAMKGPHPDELLLVGLLTMIKATVIRYGSDYVLREGAVELIKGTRVLLNADHGPRLDMGQVDRNLCDMAATIHFCLDHDRFDDECTKEVRP